MSQYLANYGWLGWIVIGGLAGLIARAVVPGREPGGCLTTILLGIGGAVVAGFLGEQMGWYERSDSAGFLAAIAGAIGLLVIYRLVARR